MNSQPNKSKNEMSDNREEKQVTCCVCLKWKHEACAGVDSDDADEFTYDFCVEV